MANKFEELSAYIAVVEKNSFTQAANYLEITKSSLSRRVSELEKRLGVQLLQRSTRTLTLTEHGEHFYQRAKLLIDELEEAENEIRDEQQQIKGKIKLSIPFLLSSVGFAKVITDFVSENPEVDVRLELNDQHVNIIGEGFDFVIRIGVLKDSNLIAKKIATVRFVTCASPEYLLKNGTPKHPEDLKQHYGLMYTNTSNQRQWSYHINNQQLVYLPKKVLSVNNGDFLAQAAINGLGIARSPLFIVDEYIKNNQLTIILANYDQASVGMYVMFPSKRLIPYRVRQLVDKIQQHFDEL